MKISGSGSSVFKQLYKELQKKNKIKSKTKVTTQQIQKTKKITKKLLAKSEPLFTDWEEKVRKKLKQSNIIFQTKFRRFPLIIDDKIIYEYEPDFILKNYQYKDKRILIEAHENITENDLAKYGLFMEKYGSQYYLIMIVKGEQLREWNEFDQNEKSIFDDIWVMEDLNYFIKDIKKYKGQTNTNMEFLQAICTHCQRKAHGTIQIQELFEYKKMSNDTAKNQSLCKKCRKEHGKMMLGKNNEFHSSKKIILKSKIVLCIGCGEKFETIDPEQGFCEACLKQF